MKKTISSPHGKLIAEKLLTIRNNAQLTQRELAKRLKKEHSFVAHYELGERRIDIAEFYWICLACEVSPQKEITSLLKSFSKLDG